MIDLSRIKVRRGMTAMVVGVLVVAAVAVSACGGEEKENYEIIVGRWGYLMRLDTRNGNVSVIGKDTTYLLPREPRASIFQRRRGRYKFWGEEGDYYIFIFDTYNGELYEIEYEENYDVHIITKGIVRRKSNPKKKVEKLDLEEWRGY